jgi:hypothetical protein
MKATRFLTLIAIFATLAPLRADDATDNIDAAKKSYESGNYSEALQSLDAANQFIRQKKAEQVIKLLPDAPKDWTASEPESEVAATALMGGGVTAKRSYSRGNSSVNIKIQSDSAVMQYAAMLTNPLLLSASGAKLETVKGQRVTISLPNGESSGNLKAVVDNRYLVEIEGNSVTADDLRTFAKAFDFAKLAALK